MKELFTSFKDIKCWFIAVGLIKEPFVINKDDEEKYYMELINYRNLIKESIFNYIDSNIPFNNLIESTNTIIESNKISPKLVFKESSYILNYTSLREEYNKLLVLMAIEVMKLLTSEQIKYLKKCNNHKCSLFFVDMSKNHSRKWCSMEVCGNRTKVKRFSNRKKEL